MKKALSLTLFMLTLITVFFCTSFCTSAAENEDTAKTQIQNSSTYYEYNYSEKTLTISGRGNVPNFTNSSNSETSQPWYSLKTNAMIDKIIVEEGITSLGEYCFYGVAAKEIILPSTLERLLNNSFAANSVLQTIDISSVKSISNYAFYGCEGLESIYFSKALSYIGYNAFEGCTALSSVKFESMNMSTMISGNAFLNCPSLKSVDIPRYASLGSRSFGYKSIPVSTIYEDFSIGVFRDSKAYTYSKNNNLVINRRMLDSMVINEGDELTGAYYSDNLKESIKYYFTAPASCRYVFYSSGDVDLDCTLSDSNGKVVAAAVDNSDTDLNFTLEHLLSEGEVYCFEVSSINSIGDYTLCLMPTGFTGADIDWNIELSASTVLNDKPTVQELISGMSVDFYYDSGYVYKMQFAEGSSYLGMKLHYEGVLEDKLNCGDNIDYILVGEKRLEFNIRVNHSYSKTVFEPTVKIDGFTRYVCDLCSNSYITDFVEKLGQDVHGRLMVLEAPHAGAIEGIGIPEASIYDNEGNWIAETDENGYFYVYSVYDNITFETNLGMLRTVKIEKGKADLGNIAIVNCDFNSDGYVNAKDFAVIKSVFGEYDAEDYTFKSIDINRNGQIDYGDWEYAQSFLAYGKLDDNVY